MDNVVHEKTLLAKLLAAENITVIHKKTKTARFNLQTRTLTCPVWKDMDGDLYDLLLGHETSYALHTPPEGWHDVLEDNPKKKAFRHFLNVVEDARIERFIKDKFPGIRKPMMNGYATLLQRGMFGLSSVDNYDDLYLIDKLNLSAKLGSLINIRFKSIEKPFYDRIMTVHTWDDVVKLAHDLYDYSKKEQKEDADRRKQEMHEKMKQLQDEADEEEREMMGDEEDDEFDDEFDDGYDFEDEDESESGDKSGSHSESNEDDNNENQDDDNGEEEKNNGGKADKRTTENEIKENKNKGNKKNNNSRNENESDEDLHKKKAESGDGTRGSADEFIPRSKTDESFRNKEDQLIENDEVEYIDVNIPQVNHKDLLVSCDVVNRGLSSVYSTDQARLEALELYNRFKQKNHDYIMLLVKEFEMRKAARAYKRVKISESGEIDTKKLPFYRLSDDIFKKMMKVQDGKSHGLVLVMDKSGSMSKHIRGAMEQILILAMFCRKVNIPFIAFTFTNNSGSTKRHDFGDFRYNQGLKPFSMGVGDLDLGEVDLREILNSTMNLAKFTQSVINQLVVSHGLGMIKKFDLPYHEGMGGTPLNETLIGLRDVVRMFKKKHGLDIVNTVVIHDGDADTRGSFYSSVHGYKKHFSVASSSQQITIHDTKERLSIRLNRGDKRSLTVGLMKWFQMTTGSGLYGFYITDKTQHELRNALTSYFFNKEGVKFQYNPTDPEQALYFSKIREKFTDDKFLESYTPGYSRFFFIPGSTDLHAESGIIPDSTKAWTPGRLLSAFVKAGRKQQVSRVLVSKFIGMIAKD